MRMRRWLRQLFCFHGEPVIALLRGREVFVSYAWEYMEIVYIMPDMMSVKVRCEQCGAEEMSKPFRVPSKLVAPEGRHVGQ